MVGIVTAVAATMRSEMKCCILTMNEQIRSSPLSCAPAPGRCPQVVESAMVDNPVSSQVIMECLSLSHLGVRFWKIPKSPAAIELIYLPVHVVSFLKLILANVIA